MRHRRLDAPYPAQTINGLIAHLSHFASESAVTALVPPIRALDPLRTIQRKSLKLQEVPGEALRRAMVSSGLSGYEALCVHSLIRSDARTDGKSFGCRTDL